MDWTGCDLVEVVSGVPLVKGTRVPADVLVSNFEAGSRIEEIAESYPSVPSETLEAVLLYASERRAWDTETLVDWSECPFVERLPGRCSGAPTVVGTRIFADTIAENHWLGSSVAEIVEDYPSLSEETVRGMIVYAQARERLKASAA